MDELSEKEQSLLLLVMDGIIMEAFRKWQATEQGPNRERLKGLCHDLADLGVHLCDILESSPTVH